MHLPCRQIQATGYPYNAKRELCCKKPHPHFFFHPVIPTVLGPLGIPYLGGFFDSRALPFLSPSPALSLGVTELDLSPINGSRCCRRCSNSIPASSPVCVRVSGILPNGLLADRICPLPGLDDRSPAINEASGSVRLFSLPLPISDESPLGCVGMKPGDRDPTGECVP